MITLIALLVTKSVTALDTKVDAMASNVVTDLVTNRAISVIIT